MHARECVCACACVLCAEGGGRLWLWWLMLPLIAVERRRQQAAREEEAAVSATDLVAKRLSALQGQRSGGDNMVSVTACARRRYLVLPPEAVLEREWLDAQVTHGPRVSAMEPSDRVAAVVMSYAGWLTVANALDRVLVIAPPFDGQRYE